MRVRIRSGARSTSRSTPPRPGRTRSGAYWSGWSGCCRAPVAAPPLVLADARPGTGRSCPSPGHAGGAALRRVRRRARRQFARCARWTGLTLVIATRDSSPTSLRACPGRRDDLQRRRSAVRAAARARYPRLVDAPRVAAAEQEMHYGYGTALFRSPASTPWPSGRAAATTAARGAPGVAGDRLPSTSCAGSDVQPQHLHEIGRRILVARRGREDVDGRLRGL